MWIDPNTEIVYRTAVDVRRGFPNTSFPTDMTDESAASVGLMPLASPAPPSFNRLTETRTEIAPALVEGVWTRQYAVAPLSAEDAAARLAEARENVAARIRSLRDRKMVEGGYRHDGKWFHSDLASRIQQLGLNMAGNAIPPQTKWKTMDGTLVMMAPAVAQGIFAAAMQKDLALFERGEQLIAAVNASSDPESVDITTGWPATYGGV